MTAQRDNSSAWRILVLGCGSIGRRRLANLRALGVEQIYAYEPDPLVRAEAAGQFGIPVLADLEEGWRVRPDAALIAAPTQAHIELALEAARHGCHLFVEKPLSYDLENVEALCTEIERRGLVSMVGCNMRFHAGPRAVKRLLAEEVIGDVLAARLHCGSYLPRWRPRQDYRASYSAHPEWGGAVLDGIHEIDLACWYLGPARLAAACRRSAKAIGLETDGLAELILRHDRGPISSVHLNFVQRDYRRSAQIIGGMGTIYWDETDGRVLVYGPDGQITQTVESPCGWTWEQMYVDELAHFLEAVRNATETVNPVQQALAALQIAVAARAYGQEPVRSVGA